MSIVASDIKQYLSGGAGNTDPDASLGGVISTTEITDDTLNNLFDDVSGAEHTAGDVEYRCFYLKNTHATLTATDPKVYIDSNTIAADDTIAIGLDPAGVSGGATTIVNESTAPDGVSFTAPSEGSPLSIGDMAPDATIAVWVRRTVSAGSTAQAANEYTLGFKADTL